MVTKEKAVEILTQGYSYYKHSIDELKEYLLDLREDGPAKQNFSLITFYITNTSIKKLECFTETGEYIDCEAGKVLKKLVTYIIESNYRLVLNFLYGVDEKYSLLKEVGVSEEFIRKNLDYDSQYHLNEKQLKIFLLSQDKITDFYIKEYSKLATSKGIELAIKMLTIILKSAEKKDSLDMELEKKYGARFEELRLALENITEGCFRKKFQNQLGKVKELAEKDEEFRDFLEIFNEPNKLKLEFVNNRVGVDLINAIIYGSRHNTKRCEKILKACIILSPQDFLFNRRDIRFVIPLLERFKLGDEYGVEYIYHLNLSDYDACEGIESFVENLIEKNIEVVREKVFGDEKNRVLRSSYLFAKMLERNLVDEEEKRRYLDWYENKAVERYYTEIVKLLKGEVTRSGKSIESFEFLLEKEFPQDLEIVFPESTYNVRGLTAIVCDSIPLIKESCVGINISKLNSIVFENIGRYNNYEEYRVYKKLFSNREILEEFYRAGMDIESLFKVYLENYNGIISSERMYSFLKDYPNETDETVKNIIALNKYNSLNECKEICQTLYRKGHPFDIRVLLSWIDTAGLAVLKYLETVLKSYPEEVRDEIEERAKSKKKVISDFSIRLLRYWDNDRIERDLQEIVESEEIVRYFEKFFTKELEKKTLFNGEIDYSCVREKNSDKRVDERLIKYYISEYMGLSEIYILNGCKKISEVVNISDLREVVYNLYEKWLDKGANPKQKNILLPVTLIASPAQLELLKKQVNFWSENSKPGLASFLIQCIVTRGDKASLIYVDTIAKKFKNKKIKNLAQTALEATAELYGMSLEELEEKIIPDFDFDKNRVRYFNYGERKIKALLGGDLEITLFDSTGKQIKSLPKASAKYNDDENLVAECKEELKIIKKQLKSVAELQKFKIQKAIIKRRRWGVKRWQEIFIDNPLMNIFAIGLIWEELDSNGKVLGRFRYMEDGSFNTVDEDEYELQENSFVVSANLREMSREEKESWKEQLSDYEITQPVEQLDIPLYTLKEDEKEKKELEIIDGKEFYQATFKKVMDRYEFKYEQDYYEGIQKATYLDIEKDTEINIILKEPLMMWDYESKGSLNKITFGKVGDEKNQYNLKEVPVEVLDYAYYIVRELIGK